MQLKWMKGDIECVDSYNDMFGSNSSCNRNKYAFLKRKNSRNGKHLYKYF